VENPLQAGTEIWEGNGKKPGPARLIYIIRDPKDVNFDEFAVVYHDPSEPGTGDFSNFSMPNVHSEQRAYELLTTRRGRMEGNGSFVPQKATT
jgi:hypothetical protein